MILHVLIQTLERAAVDVEEAADLSFGTLVLVTGQLTPQQGGEGAVVGTRHRERRTHRLLVFLQVCQAHLGHAELTGGLSVFTLPAQVVGDLLPHHSLFTFTQRTRNFKKRTDVQVVRDLLQAHQLLAAVCFTATENLQSHDLTMTTHISEDLVFEQRLHVSGTDRVRTAEDVCYAGLTEPVSTLGLSGLAQNQPAGLTAVFGLRTFYKVISESPVDRQEASRDALCSSEVTDWPGIGWSMKGRGQGERRGQGGRHLLERKLHLPPIRAPSC